MKDENIDVEAHCMAVRAALPAATAEPAQVTLGMSLETTCPHCGLAVDLMDGDMAPVARAFAMADKLNGLEGMIADCPSCTGEIKVELVI